MICTFFSWIAGEGIDEIVPQWIASSIVSGGLTPGEVIGFLSGIIQVTAELTSQPDDIWPELLPGPPSSEFSSKFLAFIEDVARSGALEKVEDSNIITPGNIVLDYPMRIERATLDQRSGEDIVVYYAERADVFMDEHGIQWIKFVARNGYEVGKEHIFRTDTPGFTIVRQDR